MTFVSDASILGEKNLNKQNHVDLDHVFMCLCLCYMTRLVHKLTMLMFVFVFVL